MATYKDIKLQITALEKKANEARLAESAKVITSIKSQIANYDLTPEDLFDNIPEVAVQKSMKKGRPKAIKPAATVKPANPPKYMDPKTGATWSGFGKRPAWIADAARKGKKDNYLIETVLALRAEKAAAKDAKKAIAAPAKKAPAKKSPAKKAPAVESAHSEVVDPRVEQAADAAQENIEQ